MLAYSVPQSAKCADSVQAAFDEWGDGVDAEVVYFDSSLAYGDKNLSVQVGKMKDAGVDFVTTCMDTNGVVTLATEMDKQGLDARQYLPNGYDHTFVEQYGDLFEGSIVRTDFVPFEIAAEDQPKGLSEFLAWMDKNGKTPDRDLGVGLDERRAVRRRPQGGRPGLRPGRSVIAAINEMTDWTGDGITFGVDWTKQHTGSADDKIFCQAFITIEGSEFVTSDWGEKGKPFTCVDGADPTQPRRHERELSVRPAGQAGCPACSRRRERSTAFCTLPDGVRGRSSISAELLGPLLAGQAGVAERGADRVEVGAARRRPDGRMTAHTRSPKRSSGAGHHGDLGDARDAHQQLLDLDGADVLAAADDDVLQAVGDAQAAVVVEHADVAGAEPAVGVERGGGRARVGVAGEAVRAAARGSRRARPTATSLAVVVDEADLDAGQRAAVGVAALVLGVVVHDAGDRRVLGRPVHAHDRDAQARWPGRRPRPGRRRRRGRCSRMMARCSGVQSGWSSRLEQEERGARARRSGRARASARRTPRRVPDVDAG